MTKYRIVKEKGYTYLHSLQIKIWGLFWIRLQSNCTLEDCYRELDQLQREKQAKKDNPKHLIVKEFEF